MTDEPLIETETAHHEVQVVLYLNEHGGRDAVLVKALLAPIPDADGAAHFDRVCGDGPDTGWAYVGDLDGSTLATLPDVFVVACRAKTTDIHAFLAALPWGNVASGVAVFNGTDKAKIQVNVLGRWAMP